MSVDYRAGWVPFDQDNGQTPAVLGLAVAWIEQECVEQGRAGLLMTPKKDISLYAEPIQEFAARHEWITRRGGMRRRPAGGGPVLIHCPTFDDFATQPASPWFVTVCDRVAGRAPSRVGVSSWRPEPCDRRDDAAAR